MEHLNRLHLFYIAGEVEIPRIRFGDIFLDSGDYNWTGIIHNVKDFVLKFLREELSVPNFIDKEKIWFFIQLFHSYFHIFFIRLFLWLVRIFSIRKPFRLFLPIQRKNAVMLFRSFLIKKLKGCDIFLFVNHR